MANVIIFGLQDFAELAHYYLENDSEHTVVGFTVNKKYLPSEKTYKGLPIIAFEDLLTAYPPKDYQFFAPMAPTGMNKFRETIYNEAKEKGYTCISYISSKATVLSNHIGDNCFILEDNTIQPFTEIGNNVVMWSGNHIGHHSKIEDHVMFTSQVVLSGHCLVEQYCFLGVNATIRDGVKLGQGTLVAMATSITKNTDSWGVYVGNPSKKLENKHSSTMM